MARAAEGWKLTRDARNGLYRVRFTHAGRRFKLATGTRDLVEATREATRIYAQVVSGKGGTATLGTTTPSAPLDEIAAKWLADEEGTLDPVTWRQYGIYVSAHW